MSDEAVDIDPVFLAMTRPPMFMGVTYTFFVINGTVTTIVFLAANNLFAFLIGIPVHVVDHKEGVVALTFLAIIFTVEPAAAQELAPLENVVDFLVNFLTGAFARSVAIIAVAVLGYLGLTGRLRWGVAGSVIVGIALIFGAATIVDAVSGAV